MWRGVMSPGDTGGVQCELTALTGAGEHRTSCTVHPGNVEHGSRRCSDPAHYHFLGMETGMFVVNTRAVAGNI